MERVVMEKPARSGWVRGLALVGMLLSSLPALAVPVTLDFDDLSGSNTPVFANLDYQGFRLSPCSYYQLPTSGGFGDSQWFGFGIGGSARNPDFVGSETCNDGRGLLYIDRSGGTFSLDSLYGALGTGPSLVLSSSNGGLEILSAASPSLFTFTGPEWTDVSWIRLSEGFGTTVGFDHMTLHAIPEPATLALLALGLLGVAVIRARRRSLPAVLS
jgi:PEP-CTERM motif